MRPRARALMSAVIAPAILIAAAAGALASGSGRLKIELVGNLAAGVTARARVLDGRGNVVARIPLEKAVELPAGRYRVVLPYVGGEIVKDGVLVEAGRTHTILISNIATLAVSVRTATGKDPGFQVSVRGADQNHQKLASFLSGRAILIAPGQVDVHVDAPPQGYDWAGVKLIPGRRVNLELDQVVPATLTVTPTLGGNPADNTTRVIVYRAGTQHEVARSEPGQEHRFRLDPGDYDVFVANESGKGRPYLTEHGIRLTPGASVVRKFALDR